MNTPLAAKHGIAYAGLIAAAIPCLGSCSPQGVPAGRDRPAPTSQAPATIKQLPATPAAPQLVLQDTVYDLGTMETNGTGRHEFVLANQGDQALLLQRGPSSCGCCTCVCESFLPERGEIPPHASASVALQWKIKQYTGEYQQSETLTTNDPQRPELTLRVTGRITPALRVAPAQLVFTRVQEGQPAVGEVRLFGYRAQPLKILSHDFSDPAKAEFFKITCEELSPDQIAAEPLARSGCLLRVEVQPSLAAGPFQQQIVLMTNFDSAATVEIPVQGTVGSELAISGFGWDEQTGVLTLGTISAAKGTTRKLSVVARGPHAAAVKLKPVQIVPDQLQVDVGPSKPLGEGTVVQHPFTIRVPANSRPVNHLGAKASDLGQLILETNHPKQPRLRMLVRFAVKPETGAKP